MIQITRHGTSFVRDAAWTAQRAAFKERRFVRLEGFVEPALLDALMPLVDAGDFRYRHHLDTADRPYATEFCLWHDDPLAKLLRFLTSRRELYRAVSELTDREIRAVDGRCYKRGPEHFDNWHRDDACGRVVGFSLGLQREALVGGEFEMKNKKTGVVSTFAPPSFGEVTIFDIDVSLAHRVCRVESATPRICWAGWFLKEGEDPLRKLGRLGGALPRRRSSAGTRPEISRSGQA